MSFSKPAAVGVGIQYNPEILDWFPFEDLDVGLFEILLDNVMGPLDGPYIIKPRARAVIERLRRRAVLLGHSNYGCDFGFSPLLDAAVVRRHVPLAKMMNSPWIGNHCLYGDESWLDTWSSPIQFSHGEVARCSERARGIQELYGVPLATENAAYYMPCPGAEMREAEFMARLVDRAGTFLHLDLHNIYVLTVHMAGGSWFQGMYHDWHDSKVPEPVWDMLEEVLSKVIPCAVVLEFQGQAHHPGTRVLGAEGDSAMIRSDLDRAQRLWNRYARPRMSAAEAC
jgi:uncharacterized protein (UPF0276 family)